MLPAQDDGWHAVGERTNPGQSHPGTDRHPLPIDHFSGGGSLPQVANVRHGGLAVVGEITFGKTPRQRIVAGTAAIEIGVVDSGKDRVGLSDRRLQLLFTGGILQRIQRAAHIGAAGARTGGANRPAA